jgi:hypothetical protein
MRDRLAADLALYGAATPPARRTLAELAGRIALLVGAARDP